MGFNPQSPGGTIDPNQSEWQTTDIKVKIRDTHDDKQLIFKTGVMRNVSVKVIIGDDRESTGMLINIDGEDGIVKMDQADLKNL